MSRSPSPGASHEQAPPPPTTHTSDDQPILFYVKALYNYTATVDEEFDFKAGDLIAVTETPESGWWKGHLVDATRRQDGRDVLPSNYMSTQRWVAHLPTETHEEGNAGTERSGPSDPSPATRLGGQGSSPLNGRCTSDGQQILFYTRAQYDYSATDDGEFDFRSGDLIAVTATPDNGWWRGELVDDTRRQAGRNTFPSNFVSTRGKELPVLSHPSSPMKKYTDDGQLILFYVKALYDYTATSDEEFDFREGDTIAVIDAPDMWWIGELVNETRKETGRNVFPSNYVELL